ncbi:PAS domain S-box protein [Leptospira fletcheri]|uniref:PAS domain S-box protein n=1 Tax=Leptospira fletcheri TaxID=2484981 RepID=UPI0024827E37|nr:PAS domain S-box protein [Leptospira fletcheri]
MKSESQSRSAKGDRSAKKDDAPKYLDVVFKELLDCVDQPIGIISAETGEFVSYNAAMVSLFGYPSESLRQMNVFVLSRSVGKRSEAELKSKLERAAKGEDLKFQLTLLNARSNSIRCRVRLASLSGSTGLLRIWIEDLRKQEAVRTLLKGDTDGQDFLIQNLSEDLWDWNIEENPILPGERLEGILKYSDLGYKISFDFWKNKIHPKDARTTMTLLKQTLKGKRDLFDAEYRMLSADGSYKWILTRGQVLEKKQDGQASRMLGFHIDISAQKNAEETDRQRRNLEALTTSISTELINLPGKEIGEAIRNNIEKIGRFFGMDRSYLVIYDVDTLIRELVHEYIAPKAKNRAPSWEKISKINPDSYITGQILNNKIVMLDEREVPKESASQARVILDNTGIKFFVGIPLSLAGRVIGAIGLSSESYREKIKHRFEEFEIFHLRTIGEVISNAIERRRKEEELRAERDLLAGIMNTSVAAITVLDPDGSILYANPSAEKVLGLSLEDLRQRKYDSKEWKPTSLDGGPWKPEDQPFTRVMTSKEAVFDVRHAIEDSNGLKKYLSINGSPIKNEEGRITSLVFLVTDITDSLLAERALKESEENLRLALNAAKMGTWSWNLQDDSMHWSKNTFDLFGISFEEFQGTGSGFFALVHPEDSSLMEDAVDKSLRGETKDFHLEYRIFHKDGTVHWIEGKGMVYRDVEGNPIRMAGTVTDITDRKSSEEELKASRSRFQAFYRFANEGILFVNPRTERILDTNPAFLNIFGFSPEDIQGLPASSLFTPESWTTVHARLRSFESADNLELRTVRIDGTVFPSIGNIHFYTERESFIAAISLLDTSAIHEVEILRTVNNEISVRNKLIEMQKNELQETLNDLKRTQDQLIQSEKMAALGQLIAGIAHEINNPIGAVKASNQNLQECLKRFQSLLPLVQAIFGGMSAEEVDSFRTFLNLVRQIREQLAGIEERRVKRDLVEELTNLGFSNPYIIADSLTDMGFRTVPKEAVLFLRHSHSATLLEYSTIESFFFTNTNTIQIAVDRVSKILYALKNFSHFDTESSKRLASLQENLETVLTIYQNQLKKGILVSKEYADVPKILCYPDDLLHVWTNLIYNSLQAMAFRGKISIRMFLQDSEVAVEINDDGPGIPEGIQDRIFQPFFTTKPPGEGSGLGLDIVNKIVEKHDGRIEVESRPGSTTFRVFLPYLIEEESGIISERK